MSLADAAWFKGIYEKIYRILSLENRLPPPDAIRLLERVDVEGVHERVLGFAIREKNCIYFRDIPPDPITFAHELIHLCTKSSDTDEEVYAYNLAQLAVMLAEKNVVPKRNPLALFESVTLSDVLATLSEAYGYQFRDIAEYFQLIGVIPAFIIVEKDSDGRTLMKVDPRYSEKEIVAITIISLIGGAPFDDSAFAALLRLLGKEG
ncbi:MAG: hypothetical protein ACO2O1_08255 [Candidatus Caldarchaeales archaeon]